MAVVPRSMSERVGLRGSMRDHVLEDFSGGADVAGGEHWRSSPPIGGTATAGGTEG